MSSSSLRRDGSGLLALPAQSKSQGALAFKRANRSIQTCGPLGMPTERSFMVPWSSWLRVPGPPFPRLLCLCLGSRREGAGCALSSPLNVGRGAAGPLAQAAWHRRPVLATGPRCFPDRVLLPQGKACNLGPKPQTKKPMGCWKQKTHLRPRRVPGGLSGSGGAQGCQETANSQEAGWRAGGDLREKP